MSNTELTRIQKIIVDTGLKQSEFSKKYGIPYARVAQWKSGKANPPEYMCNWLERAIENDIPVPEQTKMTVPQLVKSTGLTATAIAKLYDIPQVTFQTWASGKTNPPDYIVTYLVIFLSMDASSIKTDKTPDIMEVLERHDISPQELSKLYDIPKTTINNWIYHGNRPSDWLVRILDRLLTLEHR